MDERKNAKEATLPAKVANDNGNPAVRNSTAPPPEAPATERRKRPRISETPPAPPPPPRLDDYDPIIGRPELDELRFLARQLRGKTVKMVNSTAVGAEFFEVTKGFHNALHGGEYNLTQSAKEIFMLYNEQNRGRMEFPEDLFVIHDPQPAGLIRSRERNRGRWVWRCHIDVSNPHAEVWGFLRPFVEQYDCAIFSSPAFSRQLSIPQYLFYPAIDPLSEKNKELDEDYINKVCDDFGIDRARPIVTQISRFDRLKDPVGVIQAYKLAKKYVDCQLVLAGGGATDDPEGAAVLQEVMDEAGEDPDIIILNLPPWSALEINALQRASPLIIQKSLKEGFGLTVTEGLWKSNPTIASAVGGIPSQIIHKLTGVLVHSVEGCAYQLRYLLTHPEFAAQLGKNGREHAKENFLITVNMKRWLLLFQILLGVVQPSRTEAAA